MDDSLVKDNFIKQTQSIRVLIYNYLKEGILSKQYTEGEHLKERELAEKFNVSTTPIKAALQMLEKEGLVTIEARRGTFVSENIITSVEEINWARAALEGVASRISAIKITDEELIDLEAHINEMKYYTEKKENEKLKLLNESFHKKIISSARNSVLEQQIESVRSFDKYFRDKALAHNVELDRAFKDHYLIFESIKERNPKQAENATRNHIYRTTDFVKSLNED